MKSSIGNNIELSIFGESHGIAIGAILNGLPAGIQINESVIKAQMELRKPKGTISTQRKEADEIEIVSGVFNGTTNGTPLTILIRNQSQHSKDYDALKNVMRPSHADYTAQVKYQGHQDYRGGGHFSGRLTAPIVAAGAICIELLKQKDIHIASHIAQIAGIKDDSFSMNDDECRKQMQVCNENYFATISESVRQQMQESIEQARQNQNSVGGCIETIVTGLPAGVGEPYFHSIESTLAHLLFSIGGVKGVEFGLGFGFVQATGQQHNDAFEYINEKVVTKTNHNGGINGGISNGMPILVRCAMKPTPSIYKSQETINIQSKENTMLEIQGRHDPCIVHRARVVIDSLVAFGLVDLLLECYGPSYFQEDSHD